MRKELEVAIAAARAAGEILRSRFGQAHEVHFKGPIDIVTEADRAAEARIVERLGGEWPDDGLLTEEGGNRSGRNDRLWIVDPLDGTVNYASGSPRFGVSIALEQAGELEIGVVYEPLRDEMFAAERGKGATLNGARIRVSPIQSLERAVLCTGFPYDAWTSARDNALEFRTFLKRAFALRCTGSAALDLADVACGRRDGYWEHGLAPYDVAAGVLLVREAGGRATDYAGNPDAVYTGETVAANPAVHAEMIGYLKGSHLPVR